MLRKVTFQWGVFRNNNFYKGNFRSKYQNFKKSIKNKKQSYKFVRFHSEKTNIEKINYLKFKKIPKYKI